MTLNFTKGTGKILAGILLLFVSASLSVISRAAGLPSGFILPDFFGLPASSIRAQAVLWAAGFIVFIIVLLQCSKENSIFRRPLLLSFAWAAAACIGSVQIWNAGVYALILLLLAAACFAAQLMIFEHLKACSKYMLSKKVLDLIRTYIIMAALLAFSHLVLPFVPAGMTAALVFAVILAAAGGFYLLGFLRLEEKLKDESLKAELAEETESESAFA